MNKKRLRIVFMGTPGFAVGVLEALFENEYDVVGVITTTDKPAGRGKRIHTSAVKKYAEAHKIPILQPKSLKSTAFLKELEALQADLQIVVAFRMLPKVVWDMPKYGTFNLHASLLPAYRGAAPINWAIINGETKTGVTTFFIDDKIDTGEILLQEETDIDPNETAGSLHDRLMNIGSKLVLTTVDLISSGVYKTIEQPEIAPSDAPKIYKETCHIVWNKPLSKIYNTVRGLSPYPAAWSKFESAGEVYSIKLYQTHPEFEVHDYEIGSILSTKKTLKVAVIDGFFVLDEIQLSGKRKMDVKSLLNGFEFSTDARML